VAFLSREWPVTRLRAEQSRTGVFPLTAIIVTKLDGTSKGGMVVAIQKELGLPIKFIGISEQRDDPQPFDSKQFAQALFEE
jgi:fused signal recognition particle receptor